MTTLYVPLEIPKMPKRRLRIQYNPFMNRGWVIWYEPPGKMAVYMECKSLEGAIRECELYFRGEGMIKPLRVSENLIASVKNIGEEYAR